MFSKLRFFLILSLLFFLFPLKQSFAQSNFKTDYLTTYSVNSDGTTHVDLGINLTNTTTDYYASSYSVSLGFTDLQNIRVSDSEGTYTPSIEKNDSGAKILISFRDKALGLGAIQKFHILFDTNQIAQNNGTTWEVNIPGIDKQSDFNSFDAVVSVPNDFGAPSYIKPNVGVVNKNSITFSKDDLGNSGISIGYGEFQVYNFDLTYHLNNKNLFPVTYQIALPPNTNYQDVFINDINPKPQNVVLDRDGNFLASIEIPGGKKIAVQAKGQAKVYLNPKQEYLSSDQIKQYTQGKTYWDSSNPEIIKLANELKTPQAIYDYVVKNLSYDFNRVSSQQKRLGAANVLANPNSAVCLEFTDLFIALSRAAGIPAREINGYANTQNSKERPLSLVKDILHAWPEYYDFNKKEWIMVDPTWGNTTRGIDYFNTLDFDHFAFVVMGYNSSYPVPAGGYKEISDQGEKDVNVSVSKEIPEENKEAKITSEIAAIQNAGFPIAGYLKVYNNGNTLIPPRNLSINNSFSKNNFSVGAIPPFGFSNIYVTLAGGNFLTNTNDNIKILFGNSSIDQKIRIIPIFLNFYFIIGGITFVTILSIIIFVLATRPRNISISEQQKRNNLRGESSKS